MGASESKILANNILSACEEAERNGKDELDETRFWENQVSTGQTAVLLCLILIHTGNHQSIQNDLSLDPRYYSSFPSTRYQDSYFKVLSGGFQFLRLSKTYRASKSPSFLPAKTKPAGQNLLSESNITLEIVRPHFPNYMTS